MGYGASPIFLPHGNLDKIVQRYNKFLNSRKSYAKLDFTQRLCRWGLPAYAAFCGISPLTCTIFNPIYFGTILRNQISHISPTSLKKFIMGILGSSRVNVTNLLHSYENCYSFLHKQISQILKIFYYFSHFFILRLCTQF